MINADELLGFASRRAKANYEANRKINIPDGFINGQKSCAVSRCRMGLGRVSSNGCAAIAVYNALRFAGYSPDFPAIVLGLDTYALRAAGLLGADPEKMEKFFSACRIPAVKAADYTDFVNVMRSVKVGIICYWVAKPRRSMLHLAAVINGGNGAYYVCNRYSNRNKPSVVKSIDRLCTEERFVNGFFVS